MKVVIIGLGSQPLRQAIARANGADAVGVIELPFKRGQCAPQAASDPAADLQPLNCGRISRANAIAIDNDGWMDLEWTGKWLHSEGPEEIDADDIQIIHANLINVAARAGADWEGIPMYIGHPENNPEEGIGAPAKAWFKEFRINSGTGRLQGLPRWCGSAKADLIDSGSYKFISNYEWGDIDTETGIFHAAYFSSVGLTNFPVKKTGQKPLANAKGSETMKTAGTAVTTGTAEPADSAIRNPQSALAALGLAPRPNAITDDLAARIAALLQGAPDRDTALETIFKQLQELWMQIDELGALRTMVVSLANAVGCDAKPDALLSRCNALAGDLQAARSELAAEIVGNAVLTGAVKNTEEARANALTLVAADAKTAREHFRLNADSRGRSPSTDPLHGRRPQRANALTDPAAATPAAEVVKADKIRARANALLAVCGGNWDRAWAQASTEINKEGTAAN